MGVVGSCTVKARWCWPKLFLISHMGELCFQQFRQIGWIGGGVGCRILRDKRERIVAGERLILPLRVPPSISA